MSGNKPLRIALLTPYTGGNLGDAAIQEAAIAAIRRRRPETEIVGITLDPVRTAEAHGIPCFQLSQSSGRWREVPRVPSYPQRTQTVHGLIESLRAASRRFPRVLGVLKGLLLTVRELAREASHIIRAWRFASGTDMIVVSGGGQLDEYWGGPWGQPYALAKWTLLARLTGGRLVFLSVGTCALESRVSRSFVRFALRSAAYRSYRDEDSKRLLGHLAFVQDDPVFPDLAFSHPAAGSSVAAEVASRERLIGVSPIAYLSRHSWPRQRPATYKRYIAELARFTETLCLRGFRIRLFTTDDCDRGAVEDVRRLLGSQLPTDGVSEAASHGLADLLHEVEPMEYVVASRLHGIILSHLRRKPVLALSYDRKVDTHMADMGMSDFCGDIHAFDADGLLAQFARLEAHREAVRVELDARVKARHETLGRQYDALFGSAGSGTA